MEKNILQVLEKTSLIYPNKIVFSDNKKELTYSEYIKNVKSIGTAIAQKIRQTNSSIIIFIDKTVNCLESMMGIVYSGNFYTIIDTNSPKERIESIIDTLNPIAIISDNKNLSKLEKLNIKYDKNKILIYEEIVSTTIIKELLDEIRDKQIDTDAMYVLFTSGSTGIPKGTVVSHKSVLYKLG